MLTIAFTERKYDRLALYLHRPSLIQARSTKTGMTLSNVVLAGSQRIIHICAVEVATRYVREKIMVRHDPLRSSIHCFELKPRRMHGFAGVCGFVRLRMTILVFHHGVIWEARRRKERGNLP